MSFSKNDLENIKSKIQLSSEFEKKVRVVKKGSDHWCCCPFHEEKTPSCKINDDLGSYYCFGCGAKGDIFTIYTDLYNFTFTDAVKELAQLTGIKLSNENFKQNKENEIVFQILECATNWFENNLKNNQECKQYLNKRSISEKTVKDFRLGYSYNSQITLYKYLKKQNFDDENIFKSNIVKKDSNNNFKDFFFKRLIFPIANEYNKIVGFGGRVIDNTNPKYINSPESNFFKKRSILYNLNQAKKNIRIKKNILICEGYMDVISLHENKIKTAVAPLGTALTESQLLLSWKYANKPTIMFDGDNAGIRASYKSALMALPFLTPNKYLQFINLPHNKDPDSFINEFSLSLFIKLLKNPTPIVNFIFDQSSSTINLNNADNKISYDKYIDDLIQTINDKKIQYFYKNEFKNLFFEKIKNRNKQTITSNNKVLKETLVLKQLYSFLAAYVNHNDIRNDLYTLLLQSDLLNKNHTEFLEFFHNSETKTKNLIDFEDSEIPDEIRQIMKKIMDSSIFQLFPYSREDYNTQETLEEIKESIKNLNTRLSNLKKINKSLNEFENNSDSLSWEELRKITTELHTNSDD